MSSPYHCRCCGGPARGACINCNALVHGRDCACTCHRLQLRVLRRGELEERREAVTRAMVEALGPGRWAAGVWVTEEVAKR